MILELQPLDTLFFRDGKPFNKGEENWADAIFPPFPATIYGALRTAYFNEHIEIFEKLKSEGAKYCSMGMSQDYELAIKCGSNMLRLGTVLFS